MSIITHNGKPININNSLLTAPSDYFDFKITIDTTLGDGDNNFRLPVVATTDVDMFVFWGDGESDKITNTTDPALNHTYDSPGQYQISIRGTLTYISFFQIIDDRSKIISIDKWGDIGFSSLYRSFTNCSNLISIPGDGTGVDIFKNINQASQVFLGTYLEDQRIENYNFYDCVISLTCRGNFISVKGNSFGNSNLFQMFHSVNGSFEFDWDQVKVPPTNISNMFAWSTGTKTHKNISNVDWTQLTNGVLFTNKTLTTENYDEFLISMASQNVQNGVQIDFGNSLYTPGGDASIAKDTLINTYNWTISDGGMLT